MIGNAAELKVAMQQMLDRKIEGPALLRRMMSHDGWRIPIEVDAAGARCPVYVKDTNQVRFHLLYTDAQSYLAGAKVIGAGITEENYQEYRGVDLFADLSDDAEIAAVNWGAPPEVFFRQSQYPSLRRWARAVRVEQTLATPKPDLSMLKHFDAYYIVLQKIEGGYALTLAPDKHARKIAAIFTAEDTMDAFLKDQHGGQIEFEPITRMIPGEHLFDDLKDLGLDGIAFNYSGPAPRRMFIASLAASVMAAE